MKNETKMSAEKVVKQPKPKLMNIKLEKLHPFENHPYKVLDDDSMTELVESIKEYGLLNRIIVRPMEDTPEEYEIISGHRRVHAAKLLEMKEVPAVVHFIDRDEATKIMVDSNIQRENVSIMERGRAYRMKLDAMNRQGSRTDLTFSPVGKKLESGKKLASEVGESQTQIYRYIRLTYLVPELQEFADEGKIKLRPGVELSYLDEEAQRCIVDRIDETEVFPSHAQARRMRAAFEEGKLDYDTVTEIMNELKPNQVAKLKIPLDDIRKYVPQDYTPQQISELAIKLFKQNYDRQHNRDAR